MIPILETERLRLREWRESDLDDLASFWGDTETARFVGGEKTRDETWRLLALYVGHWHLRGYGIFAIEDKASGAWAGWAGPWFPEGWPEPEIGWGLLPAYRGRGLASEAAGAARLYAYRDLGWTTAISLIDPLNAASLGVARRVGARYEREWLLRDTPVGIYRHPSKVDLAVAA